jgi:2,4-dienoyl-CoA reductase-like NADH-dependent reductase (Old Yellow Enzyme family)/thioredoxin reductase
MPSVHDPIKIGALELPNRLILAPTVKNHASEDGYITDRVIRGFVEEARGGWGLLQCSMSFVHVEGCVFRNQIGIHNDRAIQGLHRLANAIHREGTLCAIQFSHGGALCNTAITGLPVVGASGKGGVFGPVRKLETDEVEERAQWFADSALRGKEAGFDAVNVHSCQGTLVQQFMSPYTNTRDDKWGEDPGLFPETVAKKMRAAVGPDFPIIWRLAASEFMSWLGEPGYDVDWGKKMAQRLEPHVDALDITGGRIGFTSMFSFPPLYAERATRVHLAEEIKKVVSKPVFGVAKIMDDKLAKEVVESGRADCAHFCRPAIADPHMAKKILEGRSEDIRKCISCNWCLETLFRQVEVLCAINPSYSREGEYELKPAVTKKKVMVIGAGVAGMESAITLAQRGHTVDLYEKDEEVGGLVQFVASSHPKLNTRDLRNIIDYHGVQVEKTEGLRLHLETEVTPELVQKEKPDAIIVAVGSEESVPEIPGIDSSKVVTNEDYLRSEGTIDLGKRVAVLGGNYGAETAVSLAREGKEVCMIEASATVNRPMYIQDLYSRSFMLDRLVKDAGVKIFTETKVVEINDQGVVIENAEGKQTIECDKILLAWNRKPKSGLYEKVKGMAQEVYAAGDCVKPFDIAHAIDDAAFYGRKI